MSRRALRPCLKHEEWQPCATTSPFPFATSPMPTAHVHFPPPPSLVSTHLTHSPHAYDRAPISVSPNECALPERNGRTYTPGPAKPQRRRACTPGPASASASSSPPAAQPALGGYFYPHAGFSVHREPTGPTLYPIPGLVSDGSSESDESDVVRTPPEATHMRSARSPDAVLAFLPHPPLPPMDSRAREQRKKTSRRPRLVRSEFAQDLELDGCLGGF
jgi:hypothetical protein